MAEVKARFGELEFWSRVLGREVVAVHNNVPVCRWDEEIGTKAGLIERLTVKQRVRETIMLPEEWLYGG